jgi:vacuolar-type H+-ATPase subunit H
MPEELRELISIVQNKEEEADKIVDKAKQQALAIVENAYKEKDKIFAKVKNTYEEELLEFGKEIEEAIEREKVQISKQEEEAIERLRKKRGEIVRKATEFLISQIKNYGYREG